MNLEFISIEYIVVVLGVAVLYMLYFIFIKDTSYNKNIRSMAIAIEELNKEIFYHKKRVDELGKALKNSQDRLSNDEIYAEIERSNFDYIKPVSVAIKNLQHSQGELEHSLNARMQNLESSIKQISLPASIHANDDDKIIALYNQGISLEMIAKELHLSKSEVEFVLKINRIK